MALTRPLADHRSAPVCSAGAGPAVRRSQGTWSSAGRSSRDWGPVGSLPASEGQSGRRETSPAPPQASLRQGRCRARDAELGLRRPRQGVPAIVRGGRGRGQWDRRRSVYCGAVWCGRVMSRCDASSAARSASAGGYWAPADPSPRLTRSRRVRSGRPHRSAQNPSGPHTSRGLGWSWDPEARCTQRHRASDTLFPVGRPAGSDWAARGPRPSGGVSVRQRNISGDAAGTPKIPSASGSCGRRAAPRHRRPPAGRWPGISPSRPSSSASRRGPDEMRPGTRDGYRGSTHVPGAGGTRDRSDRRRTSRCNPPRAPLTTPAKDRSATLSECPPSSRSRSSSCASRAARTMARRADAGGYVGGATRAPGGVHRCTGRVRAPTGAHRAVVWTYRWESSALPSN
jgi:hypothetical protein